MSYTKAYKILLIIVIAWFIVRLVILHYISNITLFEAHTIAVTMLQTGEMKYFLNNQYNYNYQFPIYPYLIFITYKIFGIIPKLGIVLNLVFHSLAVLVSMPFFVWVAQKTNHVTIQANAIAISLVASLAMLFHPLINYYAIVDIHPFSADLFFLMWLLYSIAQYNKTFSTKTLVILGIVFGLAILDRPTFGICIIPLYISLTNVKHKLIKAAIVLGIGLLILTPWLYRNYTIYNKLSLTSSTGQNLWIGIQQQTQGTTTLSNGDSYYKLISNDEWKTIQALNSEQQSDYFLHKYLQTIKSEPSLFSKMYLLKLKNFWGFRDDLGSLYSDSIKGLIPIYMCFYSLVLAMTIGLVIVLKRNALFIFSIPLLLSLAQACFYLETRHRIIIEPLLIFMAITYIFILKDKLLKRNNA